jgi:hypothetical protein
MYYCFDLIFQRMGSPSVIHGLLIERCLPIEIGGPSLVEKTSLASVERETCHPLTCKTKMVKLHNVKIDLGSGFKYWGEFPIYIEISCLEIQFSSDFVQNGLGTRVVYKGYCTMP